MNKNMGDDSKTPKVKKQEIKTDISVMQRDSKTDTHTLTLAFLNTQLSIVGKTPVILVCPAVPR